MTAKEVNYEEQWTKNRLKEDSPISKILDVQRSLKQSFRQRFINAIKSSQQEDS